MSERERLHTAPPEPDTGRKSVPHLVWLCAAIGLVAAAALLLVFGLSLWTLLILVIVIACPAVVAWLLMIERGYASQSERSRE